MNFAHFPHAAGMLLGLLFCAANAISATDPDLLLDVVLDPQTRQFKAEAELQIPARSFRCMNPCT